MLIYIGIISILILFHEYGHFLAARQLGIRVEKFSIGFGPKLFSRKVGDTEYMVCAIPFGGFIKMAGDTVEELKGESCEFLSNSPGHKARVIFAGPFFNYILAFLCLWMVYCLGFPKATTKIGFVVAQMPAEKAGLKVGDRIVAVDEEPVEFWKDLTKKIYVKAGEPLTLKVERGEENLVFEITPSREEVETVFGKKTKVGLIGIKPSDDIIKIRYNPIEAFGKGAIALFSMTAMTFKAIFYLIVGTMSFRDSITGPLGIFFITSNAAKQGLSSILHIMGIFSMSLAIFNLFPLPILDGGHIVLAGLEKIRKRPLNPRVEEWLSNIGMSFLIVLAIFIFCNDLVRYGYWDKVLAFFIRL